MDIERLANKARRSIGKFCMEECKSYCCRNGHLVITEKEAKAIFNAKKVEPEKIGRLKKLDTGKYSLYMGDHDNPCPGLKDYKCIIHKSINRPRVCGQFPLFIHINTVMLSARCPAVKTGLFFPFEKRFIAMGYKIYKGDSFYDSDFFKIPLDKKE